jgi:hypothetical protein
MGCGSALDTHFGMMPYFLVTDVLPEAFIRGYSTIVGSTTGIFGDRKTPRRS